VFQAGARGLLIDQNGHPIYFGLHVNSVFDDFLAGNNLKTVNGLIFAPADLQFSKGSVELKSAWQVVDDQNPPKNYITTKATVPKLKLQNGLVVVDTDTATVTVALLSLHVVFVLDGHPEFIWSTFEHVDSAGAPDLAPSARANPSLPPSEVVSTKGFTLYKAGTTVGDGILHW